MDPALLIPIPDQIPIGWGWLRFLLTLTFYLHVLAMNVMLGLAFIFFVNHFHENGAPLNRQISKKLPYAIALTVNLGIAPLLFVQVLYGHFIYVSSILMGCYWLSIIGLLITAYYGVYFYIYGYRAIVRPGRMTVSGVCLLALLLIAFFFSNNITMMLNPQSWVRYFEQPEGLLLNLGDPTLIPRYLHFIVSAAAVGGLTIALFFRYQVSRGKTENSHWIGRGCKWFAFATIINYSFGFWFLDSLPQGLLDPTGLTGRLLVIFLLAGIISGFFALFFAWNHRPLAATWFFLATLLFMVLTRDLLRAAYLAPWFTPAQLAGQAAWSPFLLFLLFLAAGLALVGWMLKTALAAHQAKELQP